MAAEQLEDLRGSLELVRGGREPAPQERMVFDLEHGVVSVGLEDGILGIDGPVWTIREDGDITGISADPEGALTTIRGMGVGRARRIYEAGVAFQNIPETESSLVLVSSENGNLSSDLLITLPRRGLRVVPPAETAANMIRVRTGERIIPWTSREKARLALIKRDPIMKKRYPTPDTGHDLMEQVCYGRRNELLILAREFTDEIVLRWSEIAPNKSIAVVLFGSVARGLVRNSNSEDPSNIDMSVIGNITGEEREQLLDVIRPTRMAMRLRILEACGVQENFSEASGNVGMYVQDVDKLINNKFACAKEYISSNAIPLYDPAGIWQAIEGAALDHEVGLIKDKAEKIAQRSRPPVVANTVFISA